MLPVEALASFVLSAVINICLTVEQPCPLVGTALLDSEGKGASNSVTFAGRAAHAWKSAPLTAAKSGLFLVQMGLGWGSRDVVPPHSQLLNPCSRLASKPPSFLKNM